MTRAGKDAETMSAEERERLTSEVMRYVLFASHQNRGAPVLRSKIGEAMSAIGGAGTRKGAGSYIVALAQKKFLDIFGFEMIELSRAQSRNKRPAKTVNESQAASAKCYALRSVLPAQMRRKFVDDPSATAARGFAIVVAALVQISNGCIREETLFEQARPARRGVGRAARRKSRRTWRRAWINGAARKATHLHARAHELRRSDDGVLLRARRRRGSHHRLRKHR